jgi:hypothetical protein
MKNLSASHGSIRRRGSPKRLRRTSQRNQIKKGTDRKPMMAFMD